MKPIDLLLLHAPSVYDFRQHSIMYGPISDLIPSSPVFEMYPLGFITMSSYLMERGLDVRIVNLALRMINDPSFDVPSFVKKLNPRAVGIDLHWLPHAHGSIEIARLVKEIHPNVPIIFGGLSSSYFHKELIQYPQVDFVFRGDSVEPPLYDLLKCLNEERSPDTVPNLTWKNGVEVRVNRMSFVPESLDYVDIRPDRMIQMVRRYRDLQSVIPFNGWWQNPITAVFTVKGCSQECVTCGSSHKACGIITHRQKPVSRSPQSLVRNMKDISRVFKGPIFLVGDLHQGSAGYAEQTLNLLSQERIPNEIVFEFFQLPPKGFLKKIDESVQRWSLELSPESHDPEVRRALDFKADHTTEEMERVIEEALSLRCNRLDIFFMIGLPRQTYPSVMETIDYCESLFQRFDQRLSCFISPMGPFIDPGSPGFESPETTGYKLFARTLEEHRKLLVQPTWKDILNYETRWMTRAELVNATYDAGERLNQLKLRYGRVDLKRGSAVATRIRRAREIQRRLDGNGADVDKVRGELRGEIQQFSVSTVCHKSELFWPTHAINFHPIGIMKSLFAM